MRDLRNTVRGLHHDDRVNALNLSKYLNIENNFVLRFGRSASLYVFRDDPPAVTEDNSLDVFPFVNVHMVVNKALALKNEKTYDNKYLVRIWYDRKDRREILIKLLSFGPVIKVLGPDSFVDEIKERLIRQKKCEL